MPAQQISATAATTRAAMGLPFYGGPLRYAQEFDWRGPLGGAVDLAFNTSPGNVAGIRLNGVACGVVRWAPDRVDVTAALRVGRNRLEIDLRGSPVTLCGREDATQLGARVRLVVHEIPLPRALAPKRQTA
jgi:hypothetical protein